MDLKSLSDRVLNGQIESQKKKLEKKMLSAVDTEKAQAYIKDLIAELERRQKAV